jgi:hypothetical protein
MIEDAHFEGLQKPNANTQCPSNIEIHLISSKPYSTSINSKKLFNKGKRWVIISCPWMKMKMKLGIGIQHQTTLALMKNHTPNLHIIDSTIDHHNNDQIDIDMPLRDHELNDNDNIDLHNNQVSPWLNHDSSVRPSSEDHDPVLQALGLSIVERNATSLLPPRPRLQFPESEYQRYLESTG